MKLRAAALLLIPAAVFGAEFQSGQAAWAVIGQSSFTSREPGLAVTSLVVARDRLYAADLSNRLWTYDLLKIGKVQDDAASRAGNGCLVCNFAPLGETNESVMPGVAAVSVWGKTVAVADPANHRVLIWRDSTSPRPDRGPDVVLRGAREGAAAGPGTLVNPVSVALDGRHVFVGDTALHRILVWNSIPVSANQSADAVLGQPDFETTSAPETPGPGSLADPVAMASDGNNLFVADAASRRILVFAPADVPLSSESIVNSASLASGPLAPGTLVSIIGRDLSEEPEASDADANHSLPKRLARTEVIFDGQALPLFSVSPNEIQAQLPYDLAKRSAASLHVRSEHSNGDVTVTSSVSVSLVSASPGLFASGGNEPREALLRHAGQSETSDEGLPVTQGTPVKPGELVTLWATGLGAVSDPESDRPLVAGVPAPASIEVAVPVTARINGQSVDVIGARIPEGAVGVYEIQIAIPYGIGPDSQARLTVAQNGSASNTVIFPFQATQ
ncbi:MAG: hypothetical protein M3Y72_20850 [Acidobacteriota bacterium]|nr:hypothetical protein [Acidobacteriota bacterium]